MLIKVPLLPPSVQEARVEAILKQVGDRIRKNDLLMELRIDHSIYQIRSPARGRLREIACSLQMPVTSQQVLAILETDDLQATTDEQIKQDIVKLYQTLLEEREGHKQFGEIPAGKPIELLIAEQARLQAEGGELSMQGLEAGESGFKSHPLLDTPYFDGADPNATANPSLDTEKNREAYQDHQLRLTNRLQLQQRHEQKLKSAMKPNS